MIVSCEMPYISTSGSVNVETGKQNCQPITKPKIQILVLCGFCVNNTKEKNS